MPARSMRRWPRRLAAPDVSGARRPHQPQEIRDLILEQELAVAALAELLAQLDERPVADLLADRHAGAQRVALGRWS